MEKDTGSFSNEPDIGDNEWESLRILNPDNTRSEQYLSSKQGQIELKRENEFDRSMEQLDNDVKEGRRSAEEAEKLKNQVLERTIKNIDWHRNFYNDSLKENPENKTKPELMPEDLQKPEVVEQPQNSEVVDMFEKQPQESDKEKEPKSNMDSLRELLDDPSTSPETRQYVSDEINNLIDIIKQRNKDFQKKQTTEELIERFADEVKDKALKKQADAKQPEEITETAPIPDLEDPKYADIPIIETPESIEEKTEPGNPEAIKRQVEIIKNNINASKDRIKKSRENITDAQKDISIVKESIRKRGSKIGFIDFLRRRKHKKTPNNPINETIQNDSENQNGGDYTDRIKEDYRFWTSIGKDGIDILIKGENLSDDNSQIIKEWYDKLDDKTKDRLPEYKYLMGKTLRNWLKNQNIIPQDLLYPDDDNQDNANRLKSRMNHLIDDYLFWNSLGEDGLKFLTKEEMPNLRNLKKSSAWWSSLRPSVQERIIKNPLNRELVEELRKRGIYKPTTANTPR